MSKRIQILARAGAVLLATLLCVAPSASARADCSWGDIEKAFKDTYHDLGDCAAQFADPAYYPVLLIVGEAVLTDAGKSFCSALKDLSDSVKNAGNKYAGLKGDAQKAWAQLPQNVQDEIKNNPALKAIYDAFNDAGSADVSKLIDAVNLVTCACRAVTSTGIGEIGSTAGSCFTKLACTLHLDTNPCDCGNPPKPVQVDCADGDNPLTSGTYSGVDCSGSFCIETVSKEDCNTPRYCFCPSPMVWNVSGDWFDSAYRCECPTAKNATGYYDPKNNSHPAGTGPLARVCLCDNTNEVINPDGTCPPVCQYPACPGDLVRNVTNARTCEFTCKCPEGYTQVADKCVIPCADPTQVQLADKTCCAPSQASSCGTCCPAGTIPNETTGACVVPPPLPPAVVRPPPRFPLPPPNAR